MKDDGNKQKADFESENSTNVTNYKDEDLTINKAELALNFKENSLKKSLSSNFCGKNEIAELNFNEEK